MMKRSGIHTSEVDLDLCYLSAREAIAAFTRRSLSPVELMRALIARAEAVNPRLNAVTERFFERALEQARSAEAAYVRGGQPRPLEGVPVAIKDAHPIAGEVTTFGSRVFKDFVADSTMPTVQRLFDAGAIMHLRTTTPELGASSITNSLLWGATRNPWNAEYSPGGSSGGSAAVVAAGMSTIADGGDSGGSVRIPAAACGLVGFKPPFGRSPLPAKAPYETLRAIGPLTRTVADAALMQNVMSGPHVSDACSLRETLTLPFEYESLAGWKIAYTLDYGGAFEVDEEVRTNTLAAVEAFRELGCMVQEVAIDWDANLLDAWIGHISTHVATVQAELLVHRDEIDPHVVRLLERGMKMLATDFYRGYITRGKMYEQFGPLLEEHRVLLAPTIALPAPAAEATHDGIFEINGVKLTGIGCWEMTYLYNMLHQLPAMSVPSGFASSGIPTGLHIAARPYDDLTVFQAAAAYERARPWRDARPNL